MPQPKSNAGRSTRKPAAKKPAASAAAKKPAASAAASKRTAAKPKAAATRRAAAARPKAAAAPRRAAAARPKPAAAPKPKPKAAVAADPTGLLEMLAKGLLLTADRIQEAMDDAVRRGRMTRDDAEELVSALVEVGRRQTGELLHDLEAMVGRSRGAAGGARSRVGDRLLREGDRARRAAGLATFPISRYDDLTAAQIAGRLSDLSPAQLRKVRDYERRHGNRKSVLAAIEKRLG